MNTSHIYDQVIIGAGFAGICMGIRLKQSGHNNFVILERDAELGGTWLVNKYPGAACDVHSHLYSFSFEPNPNWSRMFSPQEEILHYTQHCAQKYGLTEHFRFNTNVQALRFDDATSLWHIANGNGKEFVARTVVSCSGGLSQPVRPNIEGLQTFKGEMFHSAQWKSDYDLNGKTVAVIGTGASAIQLVPAIAERVKQLLLFQRTPPWLLPKPDRAISSFEQQLFRTLPFTQSIARFLLYCRNELFGTAFMVKPGMMKVAKKMALKHLHRQVKDEGLRAKLTPGYMVGCKRILLSNNYYPALTRSNVQVITESIQRINETGVQTTDGNQHNAEVLLFATGFSTTENVVPYSIHGRNGRNILDAWKDGAEAYLGTSISGFPNLFMIVGPNTGLGHNSMLLMIEAQANYILQAMETMQRHSWKELDVQPEVQRNYNAQLQLELQNTVWQKGGCVSWYQNKSGKNIALWPGYTFTFMQRTKKFEAEKYTAA